MLNLSEVKVGDYLWMEFEFEDDYPGREDIDEPLRIMAINGNVLLVMYLKSLSGTLRSIDLDTIHSRTKLYKPTTDKLRSFLLHLAAKTRDRIEALKKEKSDNDVLLNNTRSILKELMESDDASKATV
ncbi:hypothetical protein EVB97_023 [Rhizobium phage RHph_Y65]|uniref:Uncharacterized protein n=1 Tax=Rhizobium phage RHph_Y65 TaxID=2509785 RepID=A0A7S5R7K5_9CAUD|nr:hypothetical protein PQC17_gp023 [Rhizobium phage RHph_Y65]QIG72581.1 hypothetical protein EVB97_023 [Rhizobium phage RHph_Y65]